jgi:isopentenyl diphosphate isomerase/L-lactate dehydrogenase-like FMN-dependent dehydrogenase
MPARSGGTSEKRDGAVVFPQRVWGPGDGPEATLRSRRVSDPINIGDFEVIARARMEPSAFDYYAGGANDERTVADNLRAFERWVIRPRMLAGVREADTSTTVLGLPLNLPVALAPTAFNRLGHPDGELAAARAAGAAGTLMCSSTIASSSLEEIAAAAAGPLWFQLYVYRDRDVTRDLVRRAEAAGYTALVLTVDTPRLGRRERDVRNRFTLPADISIRNLERYGTPEALRWTAASNFTEYVHKLLDDSLTWESVDWLRTITALPIVIKGILTAEDAELCVQHGVSAIVVSNHGGRQLDGAIATMDALPEVVRQVAGRVPVLLDSGVRRGTDVFKALAVGASAVLIGRAYLWGLASDGEAGVRKVLEMFRSELELAMALAGCASVRAITPAHVARRGC